MRSIVTWVVLANANMIRIVADRGCGRGLVALGGKCWHAKNFARQADRVSAGQGPSQSSEIDEERGLEKSLATTVTAQLSRAYRHGEFDKLVLVAEPRVLASLRDEIDDPLRTALLGELAEDLSHQPLEIIEMRLRKL